jgi:hypothetical protein
MTVIGTYLMVAALSLSLAGCSGSLQARSVDIKKTILVNPDILKEGTDGQAIYRYVNPKTDVKQYTKVIVDPVIINKAGQLEPEQTENYQKLANNAFVYLNQELEKSYQIVRSPEPGTMRIQMALIDAESSSAVSNTLTTFMPPGIALSTVKYAATGKPMGVGEITSEMKITDASTGELLGAALDRRVGGKDISKLWSSWNNADEGLKYWAKRLGYALCTMRGATNCIVP